MHGKCVAMYLSEHGYRELQVLVKHRKQLSTVNISTSFTETVKFSIKIFSKMILIGNYTCSRSKSGSQEEKRLLATFKLPMETYQHVFSLIEKEKETSNEFL